MDSENEIKKLLSIYDVPNLESSSTPYAEYFDHRYNIAFQAHENEYIPESKRIEIEDFRFEWVKEGVQVPNPNNPVPKRASFMKVGNCQSEAVFILPEKLIRINRNGDFNETKHSLVDIDLDLVIYYPIDSLDLSWISIINEERISFDLQPVELPVFETLLNALERQAYEKLTLKLRQLQTEVLELDENACCDICRGFEGEDGNELVFCDGCFICVHQACYGILKLPEGSWVCKRCEYKAKSTTPCALCPNTGGAMKLCDDGQTWCHVACALWVPEVGFGNVETMEPIVNVSKIPIARRHLLCIICRSKSGAPIQCAVKKCNVAFHVTCARQSSLVMNTDISENDVKFHAYCPRHSKTESAKSSIPSSPKKCASSSVNSETDSDPVDNANESEEVLDFSKSEYPLYKSERFNRVEELKSRFFELIDKSAVLEMVKKTCFVIISDSLYDQVFNYWKLKRRFMFNRELVSPIPLAWSESLDKTASNEILSATTEIQREVQMLAYFKRIRFGLDRARLIVDMVLKRERKKMVLLRKMRRISELQLRPLLTDMQMQGLPMDVFQFLSTIHLGASVYENPDLLRLPTTESSSNSASKILKINVQVQPSFRVVSDNNVIDSIPGNQLMITQLNRIRIRKALGLKNDIQQEPGSIVSTIGQKRPFQTEVKPRPGPGRPRKIQPIPPTSKSDIIYKRFFSTAKSGN